MQNLSTKKKLLLTTERIAELLEVLVGMQASDESRPLDKEAHVSVAWIVDFLQIHKSNFYRNVNNKLLKPSFRVGRRPYYLKRDVERLGLPHETGAHTFSKLRPKNKEKER